MGKEKISFKEKFRYFFDNTMSAGTPALIGWLALLSLVIVSIATTIIYFTNWGATDGEQVGFFEAAWQSLMRAMDAGTVAGDTGWKYRAIMWIVTIGGIFIVSILIGVLTSGIESKLEELRKGRSRVLENNHTLILGWSSKIFSIISELVVANENQRKPRIVILADKDKIEMEEEIRAAIFDTKNTKIICRNGSPLDLNDLEIVNPHVAKSIVIVSPEIDTADTHVIKSILAITNNPKRKKEKYHIVAEIKSESNMEAAHLVGGDEAVVVLSSDIIARVTAQTCRQSGLSVVYTELLDFDGAEIYFKEENSLIGKTFKDAVFSYETSTIIGLQYADNTVKVNPPMNKIIEKGEKIIAISEDDDTIKLSGKTAWSVNLDSITTKVMREQKTERTLVLGWNNKGAAIVKELDSYVKEGSEVVIVAEKEEVHANINKLGAELKNQKLSFLLGNTTERALLRSLNVISFNHIIILCYSDINDIQEADAHTLITLLHLRNIAEEAKTNLSIVSEMLDIRNKALAEVTKADDFIVSDKLVSLLLSQLAENKYLKAVFDDLFDADGSEIYLKHATDYVKAGVEMDFYTVLESAAQKGQVAIGYRKQAFAHEVDKAYGVVVNPTKSDKITFTENDKIVLIAED